MIILTICLYFVHLLHKNQHVHVNPNLLQPLLYFIKELFCNTRQQPRPCSFVILSCQIYCGLAYSITKTSHNFPTTFQIQLLVNSNRFTQILYISLGFTSFTVQIHLQVNLNRFTHILSFSLRITWFHYQHDPNSLVGESKQIQTDSMCFTQIHILIQSNSIIISLNHILVLEFKLNVLNIIQNVNSIDIRWIQSGFNHPIQIHKFKAEFIRSCSLIIFQS